MWDLVNLNKQPLNVIGCGNKFNQDGSVRQFRGNTVISFTPNSSPLGNYALYFRSLIKQTAAASRYSFMPASSYHMTIIQLLDENLRQPTIWSKYLKLDCPLETTDTFMIKAMKQVKPITSPIKMKFRRIKASNGLTIELEPADITTQQALKAYRNQVANATGVRLPNHETYIFHVSIAYRVDRLTKAEAVELQTALQKIETLLKEKNEIFQIAEPKLTFFNNMFEFSTRRSNLTKEWNKSAD